MSITRGTMQTQIRRRIADDGTTEFYSDTFINDIIDAVCITWGTVINRYVPNFYLAHQAYTGVTDALDANYEFYDYPADHVAFVKLERRYGTGTGTVYQTVKQVNEEDQDKYRIAGASLLSLPDSLTNIQQTVSNWGDRFRLIPAPTNSSYLYRLKYLRRPTTSASDEAVLDIPDEWGEVIRLACAIKVLSRSSDAATNPMIQNLREELNQEFGILKESHRRKAMTIEGLGPLEQM